MKPLYIFFILIVFLLQSSPGITDPSSLKTLPQETNLLNWNPTPKGILFAGFEQDGNAPLRQKLLTARVRDGKGLKTKFTAEEAVYLAFLDTLYYRIDRWITVFKEKITSLESAPKNLENQLDLMKYYFNLGSLNVELAHIMGFNSKYKIEKIEKDSLLNIRQAKRIADMILDREELTDQQQAQAYLFLGAAEGSLGLLEFRAGNILSALIDGFQADNHLEKALLLEPRMEDAHLGLGIYRYGNSRLGGLGNLILQWGRDWRQVGLSHIERVIRADGLAAPMAIKTLGWFYIAVQINPNNADLQKDDPLSPNAARVRVHELIETMENRYFKNPPVKSFIGNKEITMMKAVQFALDGEFAKARDQFEKILQIIDFLEKNKGYKINPEQEMSMRAAINFCEVMLSGSTMTTQGESNKDICLKINRQVAFFDNGGRVLEYDVEKIRDEINAIFYQGLVDLSQSYCENGDLEIFNSENTF